MRLGKTEHNGYRYRIDEANIVFGCITNKHLHLAFNPHKIEFIQRDVGLH